MTGLALAPPFQTCLLSLEPLGWHAGALGVVDLPLLPLEEPSSLDLCRPAESPQLLPLPLASPSPAWLLLLIKQACLPS